MESVLYGKTMLKDLNIFIFLLFAGSAGFPETVHEYYTAADTGEFFLMENTVFL